MQPAITPAVESIIKSMDPVCVGSLVSTGPVAASSLETERSPDVFSPNSTGSTSSSSDSLVTDPDTGMIAGDGAGEIGKTG